MLTEFILSNFKINIRTILCINLIRYKVILPICMIIDIMLNSKFTNGQSNHQYSNKFITAN